MLDTVVAHPTPWFFKRPAPPKALPISATLPDEQLARLIQQGEGLGFAEGEALTLLVERHHSPLLGYLYRLMGGDRALAEDLTQETFLRALRRIQQYQPTRPFKPWLYAIATNLARDHYKQAEQRYTDSAVDTTLETLPNPHTSSLDTALLAEAEARQVNAAVSALPAHQREALVLRYYQDLSLEEIAEALRIPLGTVKSRLSLGVRRLKALLEEIDGGR